MLCSSLRMCLQIFATDGVRIRLLGLYVALGTIHPFAEHACSRQLRSWVTQLVVIHGLLGSSVGLERRHWLRWTIRLGLLCLYLRTPDPSRHNRVCDILLDLVFLTFRKTYDCGGGGFMRSTSDQLYDVGLRLVRYKLTSHRGPLQYLHGGATRCSSAKALCNCQSFSLQMNWGRIER